MALKTLSSDAVRLSGTGGFDIGNSIHKFDNLRCRVGNEGYCVAYTLARQKVTVLAIGVH